MTKTERFQLIMALTGARETILDLTDGKGRVKSQAKTDSPIVVDRIQHGLKILHSAGEST